MPILALDAALALAFQEILANRRLALHHSGLAGNQSKGNGLGEMNRQFTSSPERLLLLATAVNEPAATSSATGVLKVVAEEVLPLLKAEAAGFRGVRVAVAAVAAPAADVAHEVAADAVGVGNGR